MRLLFLKCCFLLFGVVVATSLDAQSLNTSYLFYPGGVATMDLESWISGRQDVIFRVANPSPDPVLAEIEFEIKYNQQRAVRVRCLDALTILGNTTIEIGRKTDFNNPVFDVFEGQSMESYDSELLLSTEELAQIVATRALLAGVWEFCIRFYKPGTDTKIPSEACLPLIMTEYQGPLPTYPIEDVVLSPNLPVNFQWSPVTPALGFQQHVRLQVWEMLPGQEMIEAIRANLPVLDEEVRGIPRFFWSPAAIFLNPGDSMQFAYTLTPLTPEAILAQENGGASPPATFWLKDPRPRIDPYIPPCDSIDIGPDVIRDGPDAPAVSIGCDPKPGHTYQWSSDPQGVWSTQSRIRERPLVTTRYVLVQTDPTGNCVVFDEAWVLVRRAFEVRLKIDPCGNLSPEIDLTTTIGNTNGGGSSSNNTNTSRRDAAVIVNGIPYDAYGQVIGNAVPPMNPCSQPAPPSDNPVPTLPYTYIWNTGATTPSILPSTAGTYTCTVSDGKWSSVGSYDYEPSQRFRGSFTKLVYTEQMRLNDPQMPFVIKQRGNEDDQLPVYNAYGYKVKIDGPNGFHLVLEDQTSQGFQDGEIRWAGESDATGVSARPGKYTCQVSFINCDHPDHSDTRKYEFGAIRDARVPTSQAKGARRTNTFEIKLKKAKR